ncbi:MAG: hypothetical protein PHP08_00440 [Candidatus Dojkabacteria bacterium]|nr:hypothetical protein [Candidatus Dojkabacteria bacterium]
MNLRHNPEVEKRLSLPLGISALYDLWIYFNLIPSLLKFENDYNRYSVLEEYIPLINMFYDSKLKKTRKHHKRRRNILRIRDSTNVYLDYKFEGSVRHHIDNMHVMYIPEEIHKCNQHNMFNSKGMKEINMKVVEWYDENVNSLSLASTFKMEW